MPNPEIRFYKGQSSSLTAKLNSATPNLSEGSFYLTEDDGRFYYAKDSSHVLELNQYIRQVTNAEWIDLCNATTPTIKTGDYYYITDQNILAIYEGGTGGPSVTSNWTQLNPDSTYDFSINTSASQAIQSGTPVTSEAVRSLEFQFKTGAGEALRTTKIGVDNNYLQLYSTSPAPLNNISGAEIRHRTRIINNSVPTAGSMSGTGFVQQLTSDATLSGHILTLKIPSIAYDDAGHIGEAGTGGPMWGSKLNTFTITLPDNNTYLNSVTNSSTTGALDFKDQNGQLLATGPVIKTDIIVDGVTTSLINTSTFTTSLASSDKVTELITEAQRTFNAMTYKGTWGSTNTLPTTVSIGDTYKATTSGTSGTITWKNGDLIIAHIASGKDEDANGHIAAADVRWDVVNAGDDIDTTYHIKATAGASGTGKFELKDHNNNTAGTIAAGTLMTITSSTTNVGTINHAVPTGGTTTTVSGYSNHVLTIIDTITKDNYGHITNIATTTVDLTDLIEDTTYTLEVNNKVIKLKDGAGEEVGHSLTAAAGNGINITESGSGSKTWTFAHYAPTTTDISSTSTVGAFNSSTRVLTYLKEIKKDTFGHVVALETATVTLPDNNTQYTLSNSTMSNMSAGIHGVSFGSKLQTTTGANAGTSSWTLLSGTTTNQGSENNIHIEGSNNTIYFNLQWLEI